MAKIEINRVRSLPEQTNLGNGVQFLVQRPGQRFELYVVGPNGEYNFIKALTDSEQNRLSRLTTEQVLKLEELPTQATFNARFNSLTPTSNLDFGNISMFIVKDASGQTRQIPLNDFINGLDLSGELLDPIAPGTEANPAVIPAGPSGQKRKFEPAPGFYQGFPEVTSDKRWYFFWDGSTWSLQDLGELPAYPTVDLINPTGELVPKEKAVFDLVTSPVVDGDIKQTLYDIEVDGQGYARKATNERIGSGYIELGSPYVNLNIVADESGFVLKGLDTKGNDLSEKDRYVQSETIVYNLQSDERGFVVSFEKLLKIEDSILPVEVFSTFSEEMTVVPSQSRHIGFPGMCYSLNGVAHVFYRDSATGHVGKDGTIKYTFSRNQGQTWSTPVTALQGGTTTDGINYIDWRDSKVIRVGNKLYLSAWSNEARDEPTATPYPIAYNNNIQNYIVSYNINADGTANLASEYRALVPRVNGQAIAGAGGLVEYDNIIYCTGYNVPTTGSSSAFLFRSLDLGLTFEYVSEIAPNANENTICFMEKDMYCLLRVANDGGANCPMYRSKDQGLTWQKTGNADGYFHGHSSKNMGNYIMIAGRSGSSGATTVKFVDQNAKDVVSSFAWFSGGDSAYCQIGQYQRLVTIVYYKQFTTTQWGLVMRNVNVSNISNLY